MLRVRSSAPFTSRDLARHLDEKKIGNRMLFGGNLVRQPVFVQLRKDRPTAFRVITELPGSDAIMNTGLFFGTYPRLSESMLILEVATIHAFVKSHIK